MTTRATTATTSRLTTAARPRPPRRDRGPGYALGLLLASAAAAFGGVYLWAVVPLLLGTAALAVRTRRQLSGLAWDRSIDLPLLALLALILVQLLPLPATLTAFLSPGVPSYLRAASLREGPGTALPLTLDARATLHAWLTACCCIGTFWVARAIFARGGIRAVITTLAWAAAAFVLLSFAQAASGTHLVYGFWRPLDAGARPFGPFINRNHAGTWSVLALFLCFGALQWRRAAVPPRHGWSWRARLAHAVEGRTLTLALAVVLLAAGVALGASRSSMVALASGAVYMTLAAPRSSVDRRSSLWTGTLALAAALTMVAYADLDRLMSRVDETRQLGLSQRLSIWRDTLDVIRDFPVAGAGAGTFSIVMRLYQTHERTYYWNEAHNHYLQLAAEGGLLLGLPAAAALLGLFRSGHRALRRREDPLHWMRLGASAALVAVAVQSFWETGLTLPANGMLAAVAAAILVHAPRTASDAAARR